MASRLTVIFYILLCLEAGVVLTLLPWWQPWFGMGDWGDNFFLVYARAEDGPEGLQRAVASGWVRGAVTGLGAAQSGDGLLGDIPLQRDRRTPSGRRRAERA